MDGSAHRWSAPLAGRVTLAGELSLRLVMTKFGPPAVEIAYEVRLEAP